MALRKVHNEAELLERIAGGDRGAFSDLFYAYHQPVGVFVNTLVDSTEITEDIIQDVFVALWTNRAELPGISNFTGYLFILARNSSLNYIRRTANERRRYMEYLELTDGLAAVEVGEPEPDYLALLDRAVERLPPQQQKVFMLRKQGLKNPEIVEKLGLTLSSVKKYQQLALRAVSDFVKTNSIISLLMIVRWW